MVEIRYVAEIDPVTLKEFKELIRASNPDNPKSALRLLNSAFIEDQIKGGHLAEELVHALVREAEDYYNNKDWKQTREDLAFLAMMMPIAAQAMSKSKETLSLKGYGEPLGRIIFRYHPELMDTLIAERRETLPVDMTEVKAPLNTPMQTPSFSLAEWLSKNRDYDKY